MTFKDLFKRSPKSIRRAVWALAVGVILLFAIVVLLIIQVQNYRAPQLSAEEKLKAITAEIGKSAILPDDEIPTIATVADPERLRGEIFFQNAMIGDQVLIYPKAKRAVLWRPSVHKVVEISSLSLSLPQTTATTTKH